MPFSSRLFQACFLLFALGGTIWLGTTLAKTLVGFDIFVPGTLTVKPTQTEAVRLQTVWLYTLLCGWSTWAFAGATIGAIGCSYLLRSAFRSHGWLLMIAILFFMIVPLQGYLTIEDFELWTKFDRISGMPLAQPFEILSTYQARATNSLLNVFNGVSLLIGVTVIVVGGIRPLHRTSNTKNQ